MMSLISKFYPLCKSRLYVQGELIQPRSSASLHKCVLSLGADFGDPWSTISRDTRLAPGLIQLKELLLQNRFSSSFPIKHIMCVFIIPFQLWIYYLHPRVPTEDSLWDGMIWGCDVLCHISMTSERFFNKLFRECYKQQTPQKGENPQHLVPWNTVPTLHQTCPLLCSATFFSCRLLVTWIFFLNLLGE